MQLRRNINVIGPSGQPRRHSYLRVSALAGVLAAIGLLTVPIAASADSTGSIGSVSEAAVTCYRDPNSRDNNRVIVGPPAMSSSPVAIGPSPTFTVGGGGVGSQGSGFHIQRVSYQANLYYWNGSSWAYYTSGPTIYGTTGDAIQRPAWEGEPSTFFATPGTGLWSVYYRFTWEADNQSQEGAVWGWATDYENHSLSYCTYL